MKAICECPACKSQLMFDNSSNRLIKCPKCSYQGQTTEFREIPTKKVYCPNCNGDFMIKLNKPVKVITCPKCKRTEVIGKYTDTPQSKGNEDLSEDSTVFRTQTKLNSDNIYMPGKLSLVKDDRCWADDNNEVQLKRGLNTLGRKSPSSSSSIQLPTTDPYMSKNHITIEITMKPDATFEHCISDNNSANGTFINKIRIEPGEIFILTPNDTIRMGRTIFKFITD